MRKNQVNWHREKKLLFGRYHIRVLAAQRLLVLVFFNYSTRTSRQHLS